MLKIGESTYEYEVLCIILVPFLQVLNDLDKMLNKMSAMFRAVGVELSHLRYPPVAATAASVFPWEIPSHNNLSGRLC